MIARVSHWVMAAGRCLQRGIQQVVNMRTVAQLSSKEGLVVASKLQAYGWPEMSPVSGDDQRMLLEAV